MRMTWALLGRYLPHRGLRFMSVAIFSAMAGVLEASVLVLTVGAAVAIADGVQTVELGLPLIDSISVEVSSALWWAGAFGLLSAAAGMAVARMTAQIEAEILAATRASALRAFSKASWHYQASSREGALQETVSNHAMQVALLVVQLANGLTVTVSLVALLLAALVVNVGITVAVVGLGASVFVVLRPMSKLTRRRASEFVGLNAHFGETVAEASALALEMRVFGVEDAEGDRLVGESQVAARGAFLTRFASQTGAVVYRNAAILFLVIAVGALYAIGGVDLSAVGMVVVIMVRALSYAQQAQVALQRHNELAPNLEMIDNRIRELEAAAEHFGGVEVAHIGKVQVRDVSYAYDGEVALRDINVEIAPGELIGVVGPSGGGKSTLVQVLLRLRLPTDGEVLVDGRPYTELSPECWSRLVSVVPQEPRLFAGTVAENIAFHRPGLSRAAIVRAAERAHLAPEIDRLPNGYDTDLGARGGGLSGGQRQRLAIARALVGEPRFLVLDEPTSALDVHSEQLLQQTITDLQGRVSTLIVAHRLSTIAACERLIILDEGMVVAQGGYAEVCAHPFLRRAGLDGSPAGR